MRSLINFFINPLNIFWISILLFFLLRTKFKKRAKYFLLFAIFLLAIITTYPVPFLMIQNLELRYDPLLALNQLSQKEDIHILVLGGGHTEDPKLPATGELSAVSLVRLVEGIRIYKSLPGSKLVLSGYSKDKTQKSHAFVAGKASVILGVSPLDTCLIEEPRNTLEEALHYSNRFQSKSKLILVTSASHMARAVMHFKNAGIDPIPAPTNFHFKGELGNWWDIKPSERYIGLFNIAVHEYIGMLHGKYFWFVSNSKIK